MSLLRKLFGTKSATSASVAKERLSLLIAREHGGVALNDWLPKLQHDILEVIARYVQVDPNAVKVDMERSENLDLLEINIVLPETAAATH